MPVVKARIGTDPYRMEIRSVSGNLVIADEPLEKGGKDTGFSPKELLAAALSACTGATLRMYVGQKGWDVPWIEVETDMVEMEGAVDFKRRISIDVPLTDRQLKVLANVANACPVHKILAGKTEFHTELTKAG